MHGRLTSRCSGQAAGGTWYALSKEMLMYKLPMIGLGEPPAAELSR